jgi:hypothetical protein
METIQFKDREYPVRHLSFSFGEMRISVQSLNEQLTTSDGQYVSDEAQGVDEHIFYFVEDEFIQKHENELIEKILQETQYNAV